ncbi:BCCT family transporter [Corynebacterium alimapuense]|uniref:Glycine/betaine ABC transporter n=1 Tax=Corynebacterium alimapuense TaxID=1576874 RepID=A0A3M8K5S6_9CORY|nr:BCCT family transporter [Corynebacterium alimapuense]RNE48587.1 glycine/betaine ABC transporter [Corynebacterium alimapuense]
MTNPEHSSATEQLATMMSDADVIGEHVDDTSASAIEVADRGKAKIDWFIVAPAAAVILAVVGWGIASPTSFENFAANALSFVIENLGWAFVFFGTVFVGFMIVVATTKFGSIKLGGDDEEPEFRTVSWIAMMFAAGMGIGLMFYGASEPLTFYRDGVPGHEPNEVGTAMASALFHWTLHPWAIYAIVGLAIAYSTFRRGRRQLISSAFVPLLGKRKAEGFWGKLIDVLAIVATVFGTATSLGVGAIQIRAGLSASGIIDSPGTWTIVGIVGVLTLAFLVSALSGVGKGIQYVSNANMVMAALLAIFVFILGPTVSVLNLLPSSVASYFSQFFDMAGRTAISADGTAGEWLGSWTIFYWAWWISWSPFVGMFLARISRGRTIREFTVGVLVAPAMVSVIWFSIFGGTAIVFEQNGDSIWGDGSAETQLFSLLQSLPGGAIMGILAMILLSTFFITSADSASTVMGTLSQGGRTNATPIVSATWGLLTAIIGMVMLISGDSALPNLQSITIIAASPFLLVIIGLMFALVKDLKDDVVYVDYRSQKAFATQLARERRIYSEHLRAEEQKTRRKERLAERKQQGPIK